LQWVTFLDAFILKQKSFETGFVVSFVTRYSLVWNESKKKLLQATQMDEEPFSLDTHQIVFGDGLVA